VIVMSAFWQAAAKPKSYHAEAAHSGGLRARICFSRRFDVAPMPKVVISSPTRGASWMDHLEGMAVSRSQRSGPLPRTPRQTVPSSQSALSISGGTAIWTIFLSGIETYPLSRVAPLGLIAAIAQLRRLTP
jgi:hypothetical protein